MDPDDLEPVVILTDRQAAALPGFRVRPVRPRGGDRWQAERPNTLCFQVAAVVHRLGEASGADVARALTTPGRLITAGYAYKVLLACCRRPHLYHVRWIRPGRFAALPAAGNPTI